MLVYLLKFFHLVVALSLLGLTFFCLTRIDCKHSVILISLNKILLILAILATLTGTLLVHPKHFTFQTPWIQAAYLFVLVFCCGVLLVNYVYRSYPQVNRIKKQNVTLSFFHLLSYSLFIMILLFVVHDAVTKTTLLRLY